MLQAIDYIYGFVDTILKFLTNASNPIVRATFLNILPNQVLQNIFAFAIGLCCVWSVLKVLRG